MEIAIESFLNVYKSLEECIASPQLMRAKPLGSKPQELGAMANKLWMIWVSFYMRQAPRDKLHAKCLRDTLNYIYISSTAI